MKSYNFHSVTRKKRRPRRLILTSWTILPIGTTSRIRIQRNFCGSSENGKIVARTSHKSITRERSSRICDRSRLARAELAGVRKLLKPGDPSSSPATAASTHISMRLHNLFRWRMATRYAATGINGFCLPRTNWRNYHPTNSTTRRDFQAVYLRYPNTSASVVQKSRRNR